MITFIYGDNNYQARQALNVILKEFKAKEGIERYDPENLSAGELTNVVSGLSLFTAKRLIILSRSSENKELWAKIGELLPSVSDDLHLVVFEESVDKRTKTFKDLQKTADTLVTKRLSEAEALAWLAREATQRGIALSPAHARTIIDQAGFGQWQLHFALEKLAGYEDLNGSLIEDIIESTPQSSAFALVDAALAGNLAKVQSIVRILRVSEDAYFFFGLLAFQIFQLVTLASGQKSPAEVAKDLGVHPYPLQKMQAHARQLKRGSINSLVDIMADCDNQLKRSGAEPWSVMELALLKLATTDDRK